MGLGMILGNPSMLAPLASQGMSLQQNIPIQQNTPIHQNLSFQQTYLRSLQLAQVGSGLLSNQVNRMDASFEVPARSALLSTITPREEGNLLPVAAPPPTSEHQETQEQDAIERKTS